MRGHTVQEKLAEHLVHHQRHSVHGSPQCKHHGASVPQTCHHHGDEVIEIEAQLVPPVASQGYVHIVAEPCGEGYVPTAPEFGHVQCLIGEVEVLPQSESHHGGYAYAHVAIAGEVAIYLHAEAHQGHHQFKTIVEHGLVESPVVELRQIVGHHTLLQHSHHHQP